MVYEFRFIENSNENSKLHNENAKQLPGLLASISVLHVRNLIIVFYIITIIFTCYIHFNAIEETAKAVTKRLFNRHLKYPRPRVVSLDGKIDENVFERGWFGDFWPTEGYDAPSDRFTG